jgi:hypothetical protein
VEELTGIALDEFMAGYFACKSGEPYWPHNTEHWAEGYAFALLCEAKKDATKCRLH